MGMSIQVGHFTQISHKDLYHNVYLYKIGTIHSPGEGFGRQAGFFKRVDASKRL